MTKNDLKLIHSFIDTGNPKEELNYARLSDDGVYATDTRKAIHFNIPMLDCDNLLLHKKILNGFISLCGKYDKDIHVDSNGNLINYDVKMSCDTCTHKITDTSVDIKRIFDNKFELYFEIDTIEDIDIELAQKDCFVDLRHLTPVMEFARCDRYFVNFDKQYIKGGYTHPGSVKIIGRYDTENEHDLVKFTAIIMGREFKTKVEEINLFNMEIKEDSDVQ